MQINEERLADILVLQPTGRLDSTTSAEFEKRLLEIVQAGEHKLLLDFSALDYIASAGLRVLLMAAKRSKQGGHQMVLCGLHASIHKVFEVSGFLHILTVVADRTTAESRLGQA
jgi:stage II sporulation protein AA (anti-sigma F factor antagonist)